MKMSISNNKEIAIKLDKLATATVSSALIPTMTKNGILVGSYIVKPVDGFFSVNKRNEEYYRTYSKSAAMIIAGLMSKNYGSSHIFLVIDADRVANAMRNDIEVYKYHHSIASKNGDDCKKYIMSARFETANERYQEAKRILQQSYSKLF